jgi:branched-chain amino acid aminotransferase
MKSDYSLYIRPFMFASDDVIGVKSSDTYKFMILLSPTGPYYSAPMRIYVEEKYTRAARGGVGFAKAAGNYGASMLATAEARRKGYDQVLWTDAFEHKYTVEEVPIHIDEVIQAYQAGELKEVFGTGTAATISMIKELKYEDFNIKFDTDTWTVAPAVKRVLTDIREGRRKDTRGWMFRV